MFWAAATAIPAANTAVLTNSLLLIFLIGVLLSWFAFHGSVSSPRAADPVGNVGKQSTRAAVPTFL
jgi:hypothetical protein